MSCWWYVTYTIISLGQCKFFLYILNSQYCMNSAKNLILLYGSETKIPNGKR